MASCSITNYAVPVLLKVACRATAPHIFSGVSHCVVLTLRHRPGPDFVHVMLGWSRPSIPNKPSRCFFLRLSAILAARFLEKQSDSHCFDKGGLFGVVGVFFLPACRALWEG
jgi:hypothetical protein